MVTSGTYNFSFTTDELIQEAYELCDLELEGGYDLRTAVTSLDLLLTSWMNKGVNLWTVDQATIDLTASTTSYTLDPQVVDILDAVSRNTSAGTDQEMHAITMSEYLNRPDKDQAGRPVHYCMERNQSGHTLYVWPVPDDTTYDMIVWQIRYPQDTTYLTNPDAPRRFYPALTMGLAYWLALKNSATVPMDKRAELKQNYEDLFLDARGEDRERASFFVRPGRSR